MVATFSRLAHLWTNDNRVVRPYCAERRAYFRLFRLGDRAGIRKPAICIVGLFTPPVVEKGVQRSPFVLTLRQGGEEFGSSDTVLVTNLNTNLYERMIESC